MNLTVVFSINTSNMGYTLSIKPCALSTEFYPEFKINDDILILEGQVDNYSNPIYSIFHAHLTRLFVDASLSQFNENEIIQTIKMLDASLCVGLLTLADYKYLISLFAESDIFIKFTNLVEVKGVDDYSKGYMSITSQHLPIYDDDERLVGYFQGDKLYLTEEYVDLYVTTLSYVSSTRKIDQCTSPSRKEYLLEIREKMLKLK